MSLLYPIRKMWRQLAATSFIILFSMSNAQVAVRYYTPDSADKVLLIVPLWQRGPTVSPSVELEPNPQQVAAQVRRLLQIAKRESDPRANGQARALLQPWWNDTAAPPEILLVRAQLQQRLHRFDAASGDLNTLLQREPENSAARITLATIQTLRGNYSGAASSCNKLSRSRALRAALLCRANLMSVNGNAEKALKLYQALLQTGNTDQSQQQWLHTASAETALRLGQEETAEQHYQQAVAIPLQDPYLLRSYADFLLAQNRNQAVLRLLKNESRNDALLLRLAIASKQLNQPEAAALQADVAARFNNSRLRGDRPHQDEEARYQWRLNNNPRQALQLMIDHWATQKAPKDTYLLARIAASIGDKKTLLRLRDWQQQSQLQDLRLQAITQMLASPS